MLTVVWISNTKSIFLKIRYTKTTMSLSNQDFISFAVGVVYPLDERLSAQTKSAAEFMENLPILSREFDQRRREEISSAKDRGIVSVEYTIEFTQVETRMPTVNINGQSAPLYPSECLKTGKTYRTDIYAEIVVTMTPYRLGKDGKRVAGDPKTVVLTKRLIGSVPVMVKSPECRLYRLPAATQIALGEDPNDLGGYYIVDGGKKVLQIKQNSAGNIPQLVWIPNEGTLACKFKSMGGSAFAASSYSQIELINNKHLIINMTIGRELNIIVPFYVVYYMYGMTCDRDILATIMPDYDPKNPVHANMASMFTAQMVANYGEIKKDIGRTHSLGAFKGGAIADIPTVYNLALFVAETLNANNKSVTGQRYSFDSNEARAQTVAEIIELFDKKLFVHIGKEPEHRRQKLNFYGTLIREVYEVQNGKPPTDRNALENNAMYNPAPNWVTMFKSVFNVTVLQQFTRGIAEALRKDPTNVNIDEIFQNKVNVTFLESALAKILKAGNNPKISLNHQVTVTNRTSTVLHSPNSPFGAYVVCSEIVIGSTKNGGAASMRIRAVHGSAVGYKCSWYTIEGDKAGLNSQPALMAKYTGNIYNGPIHRLVEADVEPQELMHEEDGGFYSEVMVDGLTKGVHHDTRILARKYRCLRRAEAFDRRSCILFRAMNRGVLQFTTHVGMMYRPMIIVYGRPLTELDNKYSSWPYLPVDADGKEYTLETLPKADKDLLGDHRMYIRFTREHAQGLVDGTVTIETLVQDGVVEYIAAGECKNVIAAHDYDYFMKKRDDRTMEFTHIDVPWAKVCLSILTTPYGNCSQPVRTAYQAKYAKQVVSVSSLNLHNSFPTKHPVAWSEYNAIARTIADAVIRNGGCPVQILIACHEGFNQEDSLCVSQSFQQRGKTTINQYNTLSIEPESGHQFKNPDPEVVANCKATDYSHLVDGLPRIGTLIHKGMAIVGIVEIKNGTMSDRSRYHMKDYPIRVAATSLGHKETAVPVCKILYYSVRPIEPGDKMGARSGCKGVVSNIPPDALMVYTEDGIIPELIINIASFPSRRVCNQIKEAFVGLIAAERGSIANVTMYTEYERDKLIKYAMQLELNEHGLQTMYSGRTGRRIRAKMFVGVGHYERLDKMVRDSSSATNHAEIDLNNGQPQKGMKNDKTGGMRFGYMEHDVMQSHGGQVSNGETMYEDSDGRYMYVCDTCLGIAAVNEKRGDFRCVRKSCQKTTVSKVRNALATIALHHNLAAMGVGMKFPPAKSPL